MAEENLSPISAPKPPTVNPLGAATSAHASTLKLKPVIRKPVIGGTKPGMGTALRRPTIGKPAPAPAAAAAAAGAEPSSMEQLKTVTQKLKGITQQIPQQAILHKTGIIADQDFTEAQKQASKSRTARISLSDAIGVAPVQNEAAPMKTIRIKRPSDIQSHAPAHTATAPAPAPASAPAPAPQKPVAAPAAPAAEAPAAPAAETPAATAAEGEAASTVTQRKTLKISRPGGVAVRPTGKFGIKKPGSTALTKPSEKKAEAPADGEVADIPDLPAASAAVAAPPPAAEPEAGRIADVPPGLLVFDFILQFAACCAVGFLGYLLYTDLETAWF